MRRACKDRWLDGDFLATHFADAEVLDCRDLGWSDGEARRLAEALEHAHAHGVLRALQVLFLNDNQIGDAGLRHLGDALARGAAPAIKEVDLYGVRKSRRGLVVIDNPLSDAAVQEVADVLERRERSDA